INKPALEGAVTLAGSMRLTELGAPMARLFKPDSVKLVSRLADDIGSIGKVGGVRAMKVSVSAAESTADVSRLARTAEHYGDGYVGVSKFVGRGVLRLGDMLFTIAGWLIGGALWLWSMLVSTLNGITRVDRSFRRRRKARLQAAE